MNDKSSNSNIGWLNDRLNGIGPVLILDGGMGTELERTGVSMDSACWSGLAVLEAADSVRQVHADFIRAGADVIITNTFSSGRHMLEPIGAGEKVTAININAAKLAREAIEEVATGPVAIAGSLCEWTSADPASKWSQPQAIGEALHEQAALLAEGGVDIIAIEMAETTALSKLALDAAHATGLPVWLGLACHKTQAHEQLTTFDDANADFHAHATAVLEHARASAAITLVNVMHTAVPDVQEALEVLADIWDGPFGVYPESGFFQMPNWQFVDVISPHDLVEAARPWIEQNGIRLLGGCCGLGPDHIRAMKDAFA